MVQVVRLAAGCVLLFGCASALAQQAPTCTISVAPETVSGSGNVVVTWATANSALCVASGGWAGPKDCAGGSQTLAVSQSRTFILNVKAATGQVKFRWTKPTQNTDGTPTTIKGYTLQIADTVAGLPAATAIALPATPTEYPVVRPPGNVSGVVRAVRSDGVESGLSNVASKNVVSASGTCQTSVTVTSRPKAPALSSLMEKIKAIIG